MPNDLSDEVSAQLRDEIRAARMANEFTPIFTAMQESHRQAAKRAFDLFEIHLREAVRRFGHEDVQSALTNIVDEIELAEEEKQSECECRLEPVTPTMINPPEVKRNPNCPVHGRDWDAVRDRQIDDKLTGDA